MRFVYLVALILMFPSVGAQHFTIHNPITLPAKSPKATVTQRIGYTDISLVYHSPAAKGREVWGKLVPYGKVWRAGANENTVFTITDSVMVEGKTLAAGTYGLHLLPEANQWTVIFSKNSTSWGSYFYDPGEDAVRVTVPVLSNQPHREWMAFEFGKRDRDQFSLILSWSDKSAELNFTLNAEGIALDHIRKQLRSDAYWEWFSWCQAADYCAEYGINTEEALEWIDRSIEMRENFSNWDVKAKLLQQQGDGAGAEKAWERAIAVGDHIYLERYGRRLLREGNVERAIYVFTQALKKEDTYWRAHYNKGNALMAKGDKKEAKKAYTKALEFAPEDRKDQVTTRLGSLQ